MSQKELKNKPLVEAILELRWKLPVQGTDPHYSLLLGRFSEKIENKYPFHEALPNAQFPDAMMPYALQHRFRPEPNKWPLIQIGPGLMTVNENEGYTSWENFKEECVYALERLVEAHPAKGDENKLKFQDISLRYIDAVDVDFAQENLFGFLKKKMKIAVSFPQGLFADNKVNEKPEAFHWGTSFATNDPKGLISLSFSTGTHKGKPALIWNTLVDAVREDCPSTLEDFSEWLEKAHGLIHDWFFQIIEGDLEKKFSDV